MTRAELLIARIDLIETFLIDEKITINWNNSNYWTMINDFLFNIFLFGRNTIF